MAPSQRGRPWANDGLGSMCGPVIKIGRQNNPNAIFSKHRQPNKSIHNLISYFIDILHKPNIVFFLKYFPDTIGKSLWYLLSIYYVENRLNGSSTGVGGHASSTRFHGFHEGITPSCRPETVKKCHLCAWCVVFYTGCKNNIGDIDTQYGDIGSQDRHIDTLILNIETSILNIETSIFNIEI